MSDFAALLIAFLLGALAWWAITRAVYRMAFSPSSSARRRWLTKLDYDSLLRMKKQLDDEIQTRQP